MFKLRYDKDCEPRYMSTNSAACDLVARDQVVVAARGRAKVPTGVWIESVEWGSVPAGQIPELQLRARSGLAIKNGICLANGVGTVDADFRDEICVLLSNTSDEDFVVQKGDRIAQAVLSTVYRLGSVPVGEERCGGFGSTGIKNEIPSSRPPDPAFGMGGDVASEGSHNVAVT